MLPYEMVRELPHDFALAIQTNPKNHHKAYHVMDSFHHPGVCVSLEKTAWNLRHLLESKGIDTRKMHIIDPLSKVIGSLLEVNNTTHIPYNLTNIINASEAALAQLPLKERFIILDSLHALPLVYDDRTIISFLRTLNARLKLHHTKAMYLYDKEKLPDTVRRILHKIVDKVIQMN